MSVSGGEVSTPSGVCVPGADGIPEGLLGSMLCGDWHTEAWHTLLRHWPVVAALGVVLLAVRLVWTVVRRRRWDIHAVEARWLEITPPVSATPAATVQLWRLLATLLAAPRRLTTRPARLVWEVTATGDRMRAGLWIPPGINPTAVARVVQRAWPGARVEHTPPPRLPDKAQVAAHRLVVTQPEWLPLLDDPPMVSTRRSGAELVPAEDRLRAVFDGLAAAGRTGGALLQVHISRAPRSRVAGLRRATVDPRRARRNRYGRTLGILLAAVTCLVRGLLDLITLHSGRHQRSATAADPYAAQLTALARRKYADPPQLLATVYTAAAGPTKPAAEAAAADIGSGYGLVSAQLSRHRLRCPRAVVTARWAPLADMSLVTVAEAAVLAGLPAEPSAHGLPAAAARARMPHRDIWTPTSSSGPSAGERPDLFTIPEGDTP